MAMILLSIETGGAFGLGVRRSSWRLGRQFSILGIGGIRCRDGKELKHLLPQFIKRAGAVGAVKLATTASKPILTILRMTKRAKLVQEVVIYKWLVSGEMTGHALAFYSGVSDWY